MVEDKIIESKQVLLPEVSSPVIIQTFLLEDSNMPISMKATTGDTLLPNFLHLHLTTQ